VQLCLAEGLLALLREGDVEECAFVGALGTV
jgi:hypothetical protein